MNGWEIYRGCDTLPIYNYRKSDDDLRWLLKGWEGDETVKFNGLAELKKTIDYEFLELLDDPNSKKLFERKQKLFKMKIEYDVSSMILDSYRDDMLLSHVSGLSEALEYRNRAYKIDITKDVQGQIKGIRKKLNSLLFKIQNLESKLVKDVEDVKISVFDEMRHLEKATGINEINPFTTVVSRYISLLKEAKENGTRARNQRNAKGGNRA